MAGLTTYLLIHFLRARQTTQKKNDSTWEVYSQHKLKRITNFKLTLNIKEKERQIPAPTFCFTISGFPPVKFETGPSTTECN